MGKAKDIFLPTALVTAGIITLLELFTGGPKYEIDNHKVKEGNTYMNTIVEYPDKDKIRYSTYDRGDGKELTRVYINGKRFTSKDTSVFQKAQKRYDYLKSQIDSINLAKEQAKKESKLQKKLDEDRARTEKALEVLGN